MAKILIAGLGKGIKKDGKYKKTNYSIESENNDSIIYENENFITSALEKHFEIDKTVYIGTVGSMWDNLYSYYCDKYKLVEDEEYTFELLEASSNAKQNSEFSEINIKKFNDIFKEKAKIILTKFGVNTNEIFENFNLIMEIGNMLNDGDEIYLDITHSFRSNAMWMFLVINYITDVLDKNIEVKMISYGMLEAKYNKKIIKNGETREIEISPVVNLKAFFDLMKWIKGANELKNYGNSYTILEMIDDKDVNKKIKTFSDSLNLNYLGTIKRNLESIKRIMDKIDSIKGPGKLIIPNIVKDFIEIFGNIEKEYEFLFKIAEWNFNQKRYAMAAINLNEGLREIVADILEIEDRVSDFNDEKSEIFKYFKKIRQSIEYKPSHIKGTFDKKEEKIYKIFEHTRKIRNEIAHSKGEKDTAINDVESLKNYIRDIDVIIKDKKFIEYLKLKYNV
jgi:CRISPR-associated protein, TM1812 family